MEVFRISRTGLAGKLEASGYANRWNMDGQMVIYAASSRALATLELLVNRSNIKPDEDYLIMVISLTLNEDAIRKISSNELPENWRALRAYTLLQNIGSAWYKNQESLVLRLPSAVIPREHNFMINTKHPDFADKVSLIRKEAYFWDKRLHKE